MNTMKAGQVKAELKTSKKEVLAILIVIPLLLLGLWMAWNSSHDSQATELNKLLKLDPELAAYPYPFRVFELRDDGTAVMSTPRSPESSVLQALKIIEPDISLGDADKPEVIAAQKNLARLQMKAKKIVKAQSDVEKIQWRLDRGWLRARGAILD